MNKPKLAEMKSIYMKIAGAQADSNKPRSHSLSSATRVKIYGASARKQIHRHTRPNMRAVGGQEWANILILSLALH